MCQTFSIGTKNRIQKQRSLDAFVLKISGFETRHQNGQQRTATTQMDHFRSHTGIQTTESLCRTNLPRLRQKRERVENGNQRRPGNGCVKCCRNCLFLNDRTRDVAPTIQRGPECTRAKTGRDVSDKLVCDTNVVDLLFENVQCQKKPTGPQTLAHLHAEITNVKSTDTARF